MKRKTLVSLAAVPLLALMLTACGNTGSTGANSSSGGGGNGASNSGGSSGGSSNNSGTSSNSNVIQLGASISLTGSLAKEGKLTQDGYEFWKDWVNSHGGLKMNGKSYQVAIKYYDDESNPATAAKLVDKLINQDHIKLILGPYGTGATFAALAVTNRNGALLINTEGAGKKLFEQGSKLIIGTMPLAGDYFNGFVDMVDQLNPKPKTAAVLYSNDDFATEVAQGVKADLQKNGIQVVYYQSFPADSKNMTSVLTSVKAKHPDLLLGAGHLQESVTTTKQMKEINLNVKAAAFTVGPPTPDFPKALGKDANYVYGAAVWTPDLNYKDSLFGDTQGFVKDFQAKDGFTPDYHVAAAVSGMEVLAKGIEAANSLDPQKVRDAIGQMSSIQTEWGDFHYDPTGVIVGLKPAVDQIINDKHVTVYPTGKPQYPTPPWNQR